MFLVDLIFLYSVINLLWSGSWSKSLIGRLAPVAPIKNRPGPSPRRWSSAYRTEKQEQSELVRLSLLRKIIRRNLIFRFLFLWNQILKFSLGIIFLNQEMDVTPTALVWMSREGSTICLSEYDSTEKINNHFLIKQIQIQNICQFLKLLN